MQDGRAADGRVPQRAQPAQPERLSRWTPSCRQSRVPCGPRRNWCRPVLLQDEASVLGGEVNCPSEARRHSCATRRLALESRCWPCGSVNGQQTCKSAFLFSIARRWHGGSWFEHSGRPSAHLIGPTAIIAYDIACRRRRRDAANPRPGACCRFFY